MKRIITVQDISCVGKCSLTVALPIISAAGVETGVIVIAFAASSAVMTCQSVRRTVIAIRLSFVGCSYSVLPPCPYHLPSVLE